MGLTGQKTRKVDRCKKECTAMIERIREEVQFTADYTGRSKLSVRIYEALKKVPRHHFVPSSQQRLAYLDSALPIHCGQTISQPFIVALMTDLLSLPKDAIVLEIGTGSGYQAAVLSQLVRQVYTIETIPELAQSAQKTLSQYGYDNVKVFTGDGYSGLADHAPYDGIMVTAVAEQIPPSLLKQLKPGGRMVIPVGEHFGEQNLLLINKSETGEIDIRQVLPVSFVPLTRQRHSATTPVKSNDCFADQDQEEMGELSEDLNQ